MTREPGPVPAAKPAKKRWLPRQNLRQEAFSRRTLTWIATVASLNLLPLLADGRTHPAAAVAGAFALTAVILRHLGWSPGRLGRNLLPVVGFVAVSAEHISHATFGGLTAVAMLWLVMRPQSYRWAMDTVLLCGFLLASQVFGTPSAPMSLFVIGDVILLTATMLEIHYPEGAHRYVLTLFKHVVTLALPLGLVIMVTLTFFSRFSLALFPFLGAAGVGYNETSTLSPQHLDALAASDEPAFRVRFRGATAPNPASLYWRGSLLWTSKGMTWGREGMPSAAVHHDLLANDATYEVLLEPRYGSTLFALAGTSHLRLSAPTAAAAVALAGGLFANAASPSEVTLYQSELKDSSSAPAATAFVASGGPLQKEAASAYGRLTAVPASNDPRLVALLSTLRAGQPAPLAAVTASHLLAWFRAQQFVYSLHAPEAPAVDVADFLFRVKTGYCEQFAAAFGSVLRMAGVPTRVVLGFQGGEYNEFDGTLTVRDRHAHAWVEYWDEPTGTWVTVDPALAVERSADAGTDATAPYLWLQKMRRLAEAGAGQWYYMRLQAWPRVQAILSKGEADVRAWQPLIAAGATAAIAVGLILLAARKARSDWHAARRTPLARVYAALWRRHDPATLYRRYCDFLGAKGVARAPAEGPRAYLVRCLAVWPHAEVPLARFTDAYIAERYGNSAAHSSRPDLRHCLGTVKRAVPKA